MLAYQQCLMENLDLQNRENVQSVEAGAFFLDYMETTRSSKPTLEAIQMVHGANSLPHVC